MSPSDVLDEYARIVPFARAWGKHPRTILRWTSIPNGLPFVKLGKTRLIHVPSARQWLLDRIQQSNSPARESQARDAGQRGSRRNRRALVSADAELLERIETLRGAPGAGLGAAKPRRTQ
jgi:hypothetical protein